MILHKSNTNANVPPQVHNGRMQRIHIGHHFFGAGNLGDDLMLAGFLTSLGTGASDVRLTCCIPWERAAMRLRFPAVTWLPYDDATRQRCIAECDAWLALGDTPFQTSVGDWLLDHLMREAQWCAAAGKRMYYLCVGVNDLDAMRNAKTAALVGAATHVWTRDRHSADLLRAAHPGGRLSVGSDLAHVWLAQHRFADPLAGDIGVVLNFEDPGQFTIEALAELARGLSRRRQPRWLAQEVRELVASERTLHARLPPDVRRELPLVVPDYAGAPDVAALLAPWGVPETLLTSRYHASLIGAWMGARVAVFPRSEKVLASAEELKLGVVHRIADTAQALEAVAHAPRVAPGLLQEHATLARRCCDEAMAEMACVGR